MKMKEGEVMEEENKEQISREAELGKSLSLICLTEDNGDNILEGMQRLETDSDNLSLQSDDSDFESVNGCEEKNNESEDEFYDCESAPGAKISDESMEDICDTDILILVVHGGTIHDTGTDMVVKKSDVTTFRGACEVIMRQHYPSLVGHLVIKTVSCPNISSSSLALLSSLSPSTTTPLPLTSIPLLTTTAPQYQEYVREVVGEANKVYQGFIQSQEGLGFSGQVCLIGDSVGAILAYDALCPQQSGIREVVKKNLWSPHPTF